MNKLIYLGSNPKDIDILLIFSSILFYISPQSYKFIRHSCNMILPDPSTIRKISANLRNTPQIEEQDSNFLYYARQSFSKLKDCDKHVFLMIDEIHVKPFLDYKGGNLVGMAYDGTHLANSVHLCCREFFHHLKMLFILSQCRH